MSLAIAMGHLGVVKVLMAPLHGESGEAAASGSVNLADTNGVTPLLLAAATGRKDITRLLLENGATETVNTPAADGTTPMAAAQAGGHLEIAEMLQQACGL